MNKKTKIKMSDKNPKSLKNAKNNKSQAKVKAKASSGKGSGSKVQQDIIQLILADHKPLKKLIKVMKNSDNTLAERRKAFFEFAPLLTAHAKPEEKALYTFMKNEEELREEGFEGDVEHGLADQMIEEAKRATDDDLFGAKVKVLAELVEHHIQEEESDLLPHVKKFSDSDIRAELGQQYIALKSEIEAEGSDDAPKEKTMSGRDNQAMM